MKIFWLKHNSLSIDCIYQWKEFFLNKVHPVINPRFKSNKLDKGTKVDFQVVDIPKASDSENKNGRATDVKVIG